MHSPFRSADAIRCARSGSARISGSTKRRPGMSAMPAVRNTRVEVSLIHELPRQQSCLARLDLQREVFRIDPALGKAPRDEPQAGLPAAREHVAQFLPCVESPDRADAL